MPKIIKKLLGLTLLIATVGIATYQSMAKAGVIRCSQQSSAGSNQQ